MVYAKGFAERQFKKEPPKRPKETPLRFERRFKDPKPLLFCLKAREHGTRIPFTPHRMQAISGTSSLNPEGQIFIFRIFPTSNYTILLCTPGAINQHFYTCAHGLEMGHLVFPENFLNGYVISRKILKIKI